MSSSKYLISTYPNSFGGQALGFVHLDAQTYVIKSSKTGSAVFDYQQAFDFVSDHPELDVIPMRLVGPNIVIDADNVYK